MGGGGESMGQGWIRREYGVGCVDRSGWVWRLKTPQKTDTPWAPRGAWKNSGGGLELFRWPLDRPAGGLEDPWRWS